jgi:UDP-N-acetylmuramoyl-tripeptide--D-alanyl-D-alanine ligase
MTSEEEPLTIATVIEATEGVLVQGDPQTPLAGVSTDSRSIRPGELFFALRGERFDGHYFIAEAFQRGGRGAVVDQQGHGIADETIAIIQVADTLQALGDLANLWRRKHPIPLIAVVGSNGKTTTKEIVAGILERKDTVLKNPGNLNNLIGLPLSLLKMNAKDRAAVLEMGMNRTGEIRRLTQIAEPDVGILTNIGPVHLEGLGSIDGVMKAKGELLEGMGAHGRLIYNADDHRVVELSTGFKGAKTSFGIKNPADWMATDICTREDGGVSFQLRGPSSRISIALTLMGEHQVYNALAAAAATSHLGVGLEEIKKGLETFQPPPMRMELMELEKRIKIINDAYNANPPSMESALRTLAEVTKGRKIAVLGDMLELGEYSQQAHQELGRQVKEYGVDLLFLLGQFAPHVANGAQEAGMPSEAIYIGKDHHALSLRLARTVQQGDWVLVKGSRIMNMEVIIRELGNALWQESLKS